MDRTQNELAAPLNRLERSFNPNDWDHAAEIRMYNCAGPNMAKGTNKEECAGTPPDHDRWSVWVPLTR